MRDGDSDFGSTIKHWMAPCGENGGSELCNDQMIKWSPRIRLRRPNSSIRSYKNLIMIVQSSFPSL